MFYAPRGIFYDVSRGFCEVFGYTDSKDMEDLVLEVLKLLCEFYIIVDNYNGRKPNMKTGFSDDLGVLCSCGSFYEGLFHDTYFEVS